MASYISVTNPYISAVREYRLTDFKAKFCSNIFTSFENAIGFNHEMVDKALLKVVKLAQRCFRCIIDGKDSCDFDTVDSRCTNCEVKGFCV